VIDTAEMSYYTLPMSMGRRKRARQPAMWVSTTHLPTAASHPFYRRLNEVLCEYGFDDFVFAADTANGRPRFDYTIRRGVSTQRLGMTLLQEEGVLDLLAGC
jgi:hypothetical protein